MIKETADKDPLIKTYFMDVFNMTYVKNATVHKLKKQQKSPRLRR